MSESTNGIQPLRLLSHDVASQLHPHGPEREFAGACGVQRGREMNHHSPDAASGGSTSHPHSHHRPVQDAKILELSTELLRLILDRIEEDPNELLHVDRRCHLSQESFKPPPRAPPDPDHAHRDIANVRLTCRKFAELGAIHQFSRVRTRFSTAGFKRLERIASQPHLAHIVRKFTYLVPYFYVQGRDSVRTVYREFRSLHNVDVSVYEKKIEEQKTIVNGREDVRVLNSAIKAFVRLQHVQILPVLDDKDEKLYRFLWDYHELRQYVELRWAPACVHSTKTIGEALLQTHSPCTRFSAPILTPQSATFLAQHPPGIGPGMVESLDTLASRLTCLELLFDDAFLDTQIRDLSPLFKKVFTSAKNLEAVHVGFPNHKPLNLKLSEVFHNVKWERLVCFGIQAWKLDADEIIEFAGQHREKLRGLRLRAVFLKDGSMWKDVLMFLRTRMTRLSWVSLRRIGYVYKIPTLLPSAFEVPPPPPGGWDSDDELYSSSSSSSPSSSTLHSDHLDPGEDDSSSQDHDERSSTGSEVEPGPGEHDGEGGNEMGFPPMPITPVTAAPSDDEHWEIGDNPNDLGDNGYEVTPQMRKLWEKWVIARHPRNESSEI